MNELDNYPRPWRVTTTGKQRRTGGGYNYHIRAANDMYVAEKLMGGEDVAALIVESVNEREEPIAALKTQLATMAELNASQREQLHNVAIRAEAAEAVLADIPMASLLRFVEAILMRGQPLQWDVEAVGKWLGRNKAQP